MGNGAREFEWCHAPKARWAFWVFWKSQSSWELDTRREGSAFACSRRPWVGVTRDGGQMKKPEYKECVSLSLCRRTFKLKGNKKFRTWTKKSWVFFVFLDPMFYVIYIWTVYVRFTRSRIWLWYIDIYIYIYIYVYICVCVCVCVCEHIKIKFWKHLELFLEVH